MHRANTMYDPMAYYAPGSYVWQSHNFGIDESQLQRAGESALQAAVLSFFGGEALAQPEARSAVMTGTLVGGGIGLATGVLMTLVIVSFMRR